VLRSRYSSVRFLMSRAYSRPRDAAPHSAVTGNISSGVESPKNEIAKLSWNLERSLFERHLIPPQDIGEVRSRPVYYDGCVHTHVHILKLGCRNGTPIT